LFAVPSPRTFVFDAPAVQGGIVTEMLAVGRVGLSRELERGRSVSDPNYSSFADAIGEAARSINGTRSLDERVRAVVGAASDTIPGFDLASISVAFRGKPVETRAASSDLVEELDAIQYQTHEGPCFDAFTHPAVVLAPSLRHEERWPRYSPRASEAGVTAQMAVPLRDGAEVRGALNLYSTKAEGIDPEAVELATFFANHVALAIGWARTEEHLNNALATRKTIGQALGIVMERYQIDEEKAFAFLTRVSSTSNIKLRHVAEALVAQSDARYQVKGS
jgi:transcriptional regulator with GAF, ATPase, and Fis domain